MSLSPQGIVDWSRTGEQLLDDFPWPLAEEQYALRHFVTLRSLDKGLGETAL